MKSKCFGCKTIFEHWIWCTYYCGMCEWTHRADECRRNLKLRLADELRNEQIEKRHS